MQAGIFKRITPNNGTLPDSKDAFNVFDQISNGWILPILLVSASIPIIIILKVFISQRISERRATIDGFVRIDDTNNDLEQPLSLMPSTPQP
ncbi:MAG: hypothetical protein P1U63_13205 [Coxiellaceae bacterium]|nr:hypothetical protein [Coxiellaceae bacterium]